MHDVAQEFAEEHAKLPGHGIVVVEGMQLPLPLHFPEGVNVALVAVATHDEFPHAVPPD